MTFTAAEVVGWMNTYLWPLFRIGAMMMTAPIFATQGVPTRVRLAIAVAITLIIAPTVPEVPDVAPISLPAVLIVVQQVLVGVAMGFGLTLVFNAVIVGGQIIAMKMGLGFASMVDPVNGQQIPVVSHFYLIIATLLFLVFDAHLVLIEVIAESFQVLPIAPAGLSRQSFWEVVSWGSQMFAGAVWIALPVLASLLVVNLSFGVVARAAPQLNIFVIGMPSAIAMGFVIMLFTLPVIPPQFSQLFDDGFAMIRRLLMEGG